jgi:hypothetical protein
MHQLVSPHRSTERHYDFVLEREEVAAMLLLLIAHDLSAVELPDRTTLVSDEAETIITVRKGRGILTLSTWTHDPTDPRVSGIIDTLRGPE